MSSKVRPGEDPMDTRGSSSLDRVASWSSTGRALLSQDTLDRLIPTKLNPSDLTRKKSNNAWDKRQNRSTTDSMGQVARPHTSMSVNEPISQRLPPRSQSTLPAHIAPFGQEIVNRAERLTEDKLSSTVKEIQPRGIELTKSHTGSLTNLAIFKDQINSFEESVIEMERRVGLAATEIKRPDDQFQAFKVKSTSSFKEAPSLDGDPLDINDVEAYLTRHKRLSKMPRAATSIQKWWRMTISRIKYKRFRRAIGLFQKRFAMLCLKHWRWTCVAEDCLRYRMIGKPLWAWRLLSRNKIIWDEESAVIFLECARAGGVPQRQLFSEVSDREAFSRAGKEHNYGQGYMFGRPLNTREHVMVVQLIRRIFIWNAQVRLKRWRKRAIWCVEQVDKAQAKLQKVAESLMNEKVWLSLVVWYRLTVVQRCNQRFESWPNFEPKLAVWTSWVRSHDNKKRLASQQVTRIRARFYCRHMWLRWIRFREHLQYKEHIMKHLRDHEWRSLCRRYLVSWLEAERFRKAAKYRLGAMLRQISLACKTCKRRKEIELLIKQKWTYRLMKPVFESLRTLATSMLIIRAGSLRRLRDQSQRALWALFAWLAACSQESDDLTDRKPGGLMMLGICDAHFHFCDSWRLWAAMAKRRVHFRNYVQSRFREQVLNSFLRPFVVAWRHSNTKRSPSRDSKHSNSSHPHTKLRKDRPFLTCIDSLLTPKMVALCFLKEKQSKFIAADNERIRTLNQGERIQVKAKQYLKSLSDVLSSGGMGLKNFMSQERERSAKMLSLREDCLQRDYKMLLAKELEDSLKEFGQFYEEEYNKAKKHPSFKSQAAPVYNDVLSPVQNWFPEFPDFAGPSPDSSAEKFHQKTVIRRTMIDDASSPLMVWYKQHLDLLPFCSNLITPSDSSVHSSMQMKGSALMESSTIEGENDGQPSPSENADAEGEASASTQEVGETTEVPHDPKPPDDDTAMIDGSNMWDYNKNQKRIQNGVNEILSKMKEKLEYTATQHLPIERKSIVNEIPLDPYFDSSQEVRMANLVESYTALRSNQLGQDSTVTLMEPDSGGPMIFAAVTEVPKDGVPEIQTKPAPAAKGEINQVADVSYQLAEDESSTTFHGIDVVLDFTKPRVANDKLPSKKPNYNPTAIKAPVYLHRPQAVPEVVKEVVVPTLINEENDEKDNDRDVDELEPSDSKADGPEGGQPQQDEVQMTRSEAGSDHYDTLSGAGDSGMESNRWSATETKTRALDEKEQIWKDLMDENAWIQEEALEIKEAMKGGLDSLYWRSQVVSKRSKRQLEVQAAIEKDFQISRQLHAARISKISEGVWAEEISNVLAGLQTAGLPASRKQKRMNMTKRPPQTSEKGSGGKAVLEQESREYHDFDRMVVTSPFSTSSHQSTKYIARASPIFAASRIDERALKTAQPAPLYRQDSGSASKASEKSIPYGTVLAVDVKVLGGKANQRNREIEAQKLQSTSPSATSKSGALHERVLVRSLTCRPSTSMELAFPDRDSPCSAGRPRTQRPRTSQTFSHPQVVSLAVRKEAVGLPASAPIMTPDLVVLNAGPPLPSKQKAVLQTGDLENMRAMVEDVIGPARARFSMSGRPASQAKSSDAPSSRASSIRAATPLAGNKQDLKVEASQCESIRPKTTPKVDRIPSSREHVGSIQVKVSHNKSNTSAENLKVDTADGMKQPVAAEISSDSQHESVRNESTIVVLENGSSPNNSLSAQESNQIVLPGADMGQQLESSDAAFGDMVWRPWTGKSATAILEELKLSAEDDVGADIVVNSILPSDSEISLLQVRYVDNLPADYFLSSEKNVLDANADLLGVESNGFLCDPEDGELKDETNIVSARNSDGGEMIRFDQLEEQDQDTGIINEAVQSGSLTPIESLTRASSSTGVRQILISKQIEGVFKQLTTSKQLVMSNGIENRARGLRKQVVRRGAGSKPDESMKAAVTGTSPSAVLQFSSEAPISMLLTTRKMETPSMPLPTLARAIPRVGERSMTEKHLSILPVYDPAFDERPTAGNERCLSAQKVAFAEKQARKSSRAVSPAKGEAQKEGARHSTPKLTEHRPKSNGFRSVDHELSATKVPVHDISEWRRDMMGPVFPEEYESVVDSNPIKVGLDDYVDSEHDQRPESPPNADRHEIRVDSETLGSMDNLVEVAQVVPPVANISVEPIEHVQQAPIIVLNVDPVIAPVIVQPVKREASKEASKIKRGSSAAPVNSSVGDKSVVPNPVVKETSVEDLLRLRVVPRLGSEIDKVFAPFSSAPEHNEFVAYVSKELEGQEVFWDPSEIQALRPTGSGSRNSESRQSLSRSGSARQESISQPITQPKPDLPQQRSIAPEVPTLEDRAPNTIAVSDESAEEKLSLDQNGIRRTATNRMKRDQKKMKRKPMPIDLFKKLQKSQKNVTSISPAPWNDRNSPLTRNTGFMNAIRKMKDMSESDDDSDTNSSKSKSYGLPLTEGMLSVSHWSASPSLALAREVDRHYENTRLKKMSDLPIDVQPDGHHIPDFAVDNRGGHASRGDEILRDIMLMGRHNVTPSGVYDSYLHGIRSKLRRSSSPHSSAGDDDEINTSIDLLPAVHAPRPGEILHTVGDEG